MSANSDLHNLKMKPQQEKFEEGGEGNGGSATLSMCPNCHTKHIVGQSCPTFPVPQQEKCKHCGAPHENKQEINDFGCWQCGKKTSPHSEAWDWVKELPILEHDIGCEYRRTGKWCDCDLIVRQGKLFLFMQKLIHQTHEETVREVLNLRRFEDVECDMGMQLDPSHEEPWIHAKDVEELLQRLAQYKNSKGGI